MISFNSPDPGTEQPNGYPEVGSLWHHSKTGALYEVLLIVWLERTHKAHVCYIAVGSLGAWARPFSEWRELVTINGEMVPRFVPVEKDSNSLNPDAGWLERSNAEVLEWGERHAERRRQDIRDGLFPNVEGL